MKLLIILAIIVGCTADTNIKPTDIKPAPVTTDTPITTPKPTDAPITSIPDPAPITIKPDPIPPKDTNLNFTLNDGDNICALFNFSASVKLISNDKKSEDQIIYLSNATTVDTKKSYCNKNETSLVLNINGLNDKTLNLHLTHSGSSYRLDLVYLNVTQPEKSYLYNNTMFKVDDSKSYLCLANPQINLQIKDTKEKAIVSLKNLKVDAFRTSKDYQFRQAVQCEADFPTNDFVPLAVGCALISLVFITLIAYIVGRRRNRRLTYQSV